MRIGHRGDVLRQFRTLFEAGAISGLGDAELLERSASPSRATAELAFAALVERHGPMVLRVCRKALGDPHDAHDAFQSTFLILARKAESIRDTRSVASWLHGVALRVSATSRAASARRRRHERRRAEGMAFAVALEEPDDVSAVLHEEVGRLPGRYRAAVVLCYLEGKSHEEAADHLGCPVGTIKSRLAWSRERLRTRLSRRGLAPAAGAIATLLVAESASAAVPLPSIWVETTTEAALAFAARSFATIATGTVPASAAALAKGVIHAMLLNKIKFAALAGVLFLTVSSVGVLAQAPPPARNELQGEPDRLKAMEQKLDRLIEALEGSHARGKTPTPGATTYYTPAPAATPGGVLPAMAPVVAGSANDPFTVNTPKVAAAGAVYRVYSDVEDRLNKLEQRLNRLEQRLDRLDRRFPDDESNPQPKGTPKQP